MESPPTRGVKRRNKLLVSWGPLVPLADSLLAPLRCAAPCQFRCRETWQPSRYPHLSRAASSVAPLPRHITRRLVATAAENRSRT